MLFHQNIILIYVLTDALVIKRRTSGYTRAAHYCSSQTCFDGCSYTKYCFDGCSSYLKRKYGFFKLVNLRIVVKEENIHNVILLCSVDFLKE